jgi:hypothetical protein
VSATGRDVKQAEVVLRNLIEVQALFEEYRQRLLETVALSRI